MVRSTTARPSASSRLTPSPARRPPLHDAPVLEGEARPRRRPPRRAAARPASRPARTTRDGGTRRRRVSSSTLFKLSRASDSLRRRRPRARSGARSWLSGETIVRLPLMPHQSAAMPAAAASASIVAAVGGPPRRPPAERAFGEEEAGAGRELAAVGEGERPFGRVRGVRRRAASATPCRRAAPAGAAPRRPRSGSSPRRRGRRRRRAARRRRRPARGRPDRSSADCDIGPSASRHSTSARPVASSGWPVRKALRDSAGWSRRARDEAARRTRSAPRRPRFQSIAVVALSWA